MVVLGDNLLLPLKRDRIITRLFRKGLLLDLVLVLNGEWEGLFFAFGPSSFWTLLGKVSFLRLEWKKAEMG